MRPFRGAALLGAAACLLGAPTPQARTMAERMKAACSIEVGKFCPGLDEERTKACMLAHRREIDPVCMRLVDAAE